MAIALLAWFGTSAEAAEPVVTLRWSNGQVRAEVTPPPGEHVNAQAPAVLDDGRAEVRGPDALRWGRLPLAADTVYRVTVPLCTDDGAACRSVTLQGRTPDAPRRKGSVVLAGQDTEAAAAAPQASSGAGPDGGVRVYDFFGVWCPPCNQLRAEVLEDPADADVLAGLTIVPVDADRTDSWALKSRFGVGGYPTLVAVSPDGVVLDRLVGYPGQDATRAWFAGLGTQVALEVLDVGPLPGPHIVEPATAALRLARAEREDAARAWLAVASGDSVELRWARVLLDPSPVDADWLLDNAPDGDWLLDVLNAFPDRWPRVAPRLPAIGADATLAGLLSYAEGAPADAARAARIGAAAILEARMDADRGGGKAHVTDLASVLAEVGDLPRALRLLDDFSGRYPEEFTYDFVAARLLLDAGRFAEAETHARAALARAWGDQRLRAVQRLARALDGLGRRPEALDALDAELAASPRPRDGVDVRTWRYLGEVEALRDELRAPK